MTNLSLSIEIIPELEGYVDEEFLLHVAELALREAGETRPVEFSLVVTNDQEVRELNRTYRGLDEPTDVLSFPLTVPGEEPAVEDSTIPHFVQPPDGLVHLGDVVISYPRADAQAQEAGHAVQQELALLLAHGVLHLLGYDHAEPAEEATMRAAQERVVARALQDT